MARLGADMARLEVDTARLGADMARLGQTRLGFLGQTWLGWG